MGTTTEELTAFNLKDMCLDLFARVVSVKSENGKTVYTVCPPTCEPEKIAIFSDWWEEK